MILGSKQNERAVWIGEWLPGLLLLAAVVLAYQPAWNAGFIWDDDKYVTENPLITAPDGLKRIWFSLDSPSQYFPLTYTTFRIEHAIWGLNASGYHWVNILLHATNAVLLWRLLRRLEIPGSWIAAALFALHPVHVESVAWITERKNVLSLFFSLLAVMAWTKSLPSGSKVRVSFYAASIGCYLLALFAKTTACTLPAALLLILWIRHQPIRWRHVGLIAPFVVLGLAMGLVSVWWEQHHQGVAGKLSFGFPERVLIATRAIWFYLGKLIWPTDLCFSYPRWKLDPSNPLAYGWLFALVLFAVGIVATRRLAGRAPEAAALFYAATLSPLLGFFMLSTFRYTFVADHYQYVASIGPLTLAAAGIAKWFRSGPESKLVVKRSAVGAVLAVLALLTWRQSHIYHDPETLWRATLRCNPGSILAHGNLGHLLFSQRNLDEAIGHYETLFAIEPDAPAAYNLANAYFARGRVADALVYYQRALELEPNGAAIAFGLGKALAAQGQFDRAIAAYQRALEIQPGAPAIQARLAEAFLQIGRLGDAIRVYEEILRSRPDDVPALTNLSWILATASDSALRNGARAVELAQRANQLTQQSSPWALRSLAAARAETGQFTEAIEAVEQAMQLPEARANAALLEHLQSQLQNYRSNTPSRLRLNEQ